MAHQEAAMAHQEAAMAQQAVPMVLLEVIMAHQEVTMVLLEVIMVLQLREDMDLLTTMVHPAATAHQQTAAHHANPYARRQDRLRKWSKIISENPNAEAK